MCNPAALAIASFVMQAGSTVMQYNAENAQAKLQNRMYEDNKALALRDMQQQFADATTRQQEVNQATAHEVAERRRKALMEASTANAASADRGVGGFTVGALLAQIMGDAGRDITAIETNRDWDVAQIERDKAGIRSSMIQRTNSLTPSAGPSKMAALLSIGGSAISSYSGYKTGSFGKTS